MEEEEEEEEAEKPIKMDYRYRELPHVNAHDALDHNQRYQEVK